MTAIQPNMLGAQIRWGDRCRGKHYLTYHFVGGTYRGLARRPDRAGHRVWADRIAIGIVGALIGAWLLPHLHIHLGNSLVAAIVSATIGALVLLLILRLIYRRGGW
jgi:uncharacterized membrane protein YeaQ/YmgE (transglycosylase-associated protein family)